MFLTALALGCVAQASVASPRPAWATADEVDAFLQARVEQMRLPGLAVVVVADGEVLLEGTYGEARPGAPVTLDTPFRLGSTSKQFTGLAVQQLIGEGRLALDTPVGDILPAFAESGPPHSAVTVEDLLGHRSGLTADAGLDQWSPWPASSTLQEEASRLADMPLAAQPGDQFEYTNAGYTVLGSVVERVTGQPFDEAFRTLVAEPLGLAATTGDLEAAAANRLADPHHTWFGLTNVRARGTGAPYSGPSALLTSTARDLTTLVRAHLGTPTGMEPAVLAAAREPLGSADDHTDYASGWYVRGLWELTDDDVGWDSPDRPSLWEHEGSIPGAMSSLSFSPELGLGVVALANTGAGTDELRWWRFRYDLHHAILGTRALPQESDLLVRAAPFLMLGLPAAQLVTLLWWAATRGRRAAGVAAFVAAQTTTLICLVFAFVVVPSRTHMPLFDPRWMSSVPDLAVSVGVMLALALVAVIAAFHLVARSLGRRRR